jgi:hypothetical protein
MVLLWTLFARDCRKEGEHGHVPSDYNYCAEDSMVLTLDKYTNAPNSDFESLMSCVCEKLLKSICQTTHELWSLK